MHQVIVAQLANKRQGTQSALTRAEVSGGGKKPWRQKGTGRARVGSSRNPVWKHGGVAFAPKPRDYSKSVNKKVRRLAIKSALTGKLADKQLYVLEDLNIAALLYRLIMRIYFFYFAFFCSFNAKKVMPYFQYILIYNP